MDALTCFSCQDALFGPSHDCDLRPFFETYYDAFQREKQDDIRLFLVLFVQKHVLKKNGYQVISLVIKCEQ